MRATIVDALGKMFARGDRAFVILSDPSSDRFVQYAVASGPKVLLNIPTHGMDELLANRVADFFERKGIRPSSSTTQGLFRRRTVHTYDIEFQTAEEAADMGVEILTAVYGLRADTQLNVEIGA